MNFQDIKSNFIKDSQEEFGEEFAVSDSSNNYKLNYPWIMALNRLYEKMQFEKDNQNIYKAEGIHLDGLLTSKYAFSRKQSSKAKAKWKTTDSVTGTVIAKGDMRFIADNGATFINTNNLVIDWVGHGTFELEAEEVGTNGNVEANTINKLTLIAGINTGTNYEVSDGGQSQETDYEYRSRFLNSRNSGAYWNTDGIYAELLAVNGVTSAKVLENESDIPVNVGGLDMPSRSRRYYVQGGNNDDIASAIFKKTDRAIAESGGITKIVIDTQGQEREVVFSRPTNVDVEFQYTVDPIENIETELKEYIDTTLIGGTVSYFGVVEYLKSKGKLTNADNFAAGFRRAGSGSYELTIVLDVFEDCTGVYVP